MKGIKRVLVTGATGRLGTNLVKALICKGYDVRGFVMPGDEKEKKLANMNVEIVRGDITDSNAVTKVVQDMDAVIHTVAIMETIPRGMSRQTYFDINVKGTFNVLEAIKDNLKTVKKLVYISSTAVYDVWASKKMPLIETRPTKPTYLYGVNKIMNERMVLGYHFLYGFDVTILRPNYIMACAQILEPWTVGCVMDILKERGCDPRMSFYSKSREPWKPLERLGASSDTLIIPRGPDGKAWQWHCTDVRDAVQGTILALEKKQSSGEIFNICGPEPNDWDKVVKYISKKTGKAYIECKLPCLWRFRFSNEKAKRILGYKPQYGIKEMVDSALEFRAGKDIGVIPA